MFTQKRRNRHSHIKDTPNSKLAGWLHGRSSGQALVLFAVSFFALLAFIGLVTDVGSIYISYTQLQRAIDAAAIAAANNIKNPQSTYEERKQKMTAAAYEMLDMHEITGVDEMVIYMCDDAGKPARFTAMCPGPGQPPRKLAYIEATQESPVYFLQIFGLHSFPLHVSAVGETAAVDLVLVFDTSESMGLESDGYNPRNFNPTTCNTNNDCQPLRQAKDAAKALVGNLFDGYDQVAIVTFDYNANRHFALSTNMTAALAAVDTITLHDDAPAALVPWTAWSPWGGYRAFNPIFPDDRDGNGADADPGMPCTDQYVNDADGTLGANSPDMWDDLTGDPCDRDGQLDAYDWNGDGIWGQIADAADPTPGDGNTPGDSNWEDVSLISTCSGCGVREAIEVLADGGRQGSVWVIVFLSDGVANMSDLPATNSAIPSQFRYGFCGHDPATAFWPRYCVDPNDNSVVPNSQGRHCIDADADECPPDTTHTTETGPYSVEDYAFDMVDRAALLRSENPNEPPGEDIIMFSIGLGAASLGENLLRYMANVGDEGSRSNDACESIPALQNCGNYYYAPNASYLQRIFENIAGRIFTKISR